MQILKLRLERGWSQEQLAQTAGLSVRTVQRLERGRPGSLETLNAVAAAFDVDISCLTAADVLAEPVRPRRSHLAFAALILMLLSFVSALILPGVALFCATTAVVAASISILRGRGRAIAYPALVLGMFSLWFVLYTQVPFGGGITERINQANAQMAREQANLRH